MSKQELPVLRLKQKNVDLIFNTIMGLDNSAVITTDQLLALIRIIEKNGITFTNTGVESIDNNDAIQFSKDEFLIIKVFRYHPNGIPMAVQFIHFRLVGENANQIVVCNN